MRRHPTYLSAAAILGGAVLIAGVTGAAKAPATSAGAVRPLVTTTGPGWLAGPGGHALEKVSRDIALLPARPNAATARKLSADVVSAMKAPMPPSGAALYHTGLTKWRQAARFMVHRNYAAAAVDLKAGDTRCQCRYHGTEGGNRIRENRCHGGDRDHDHLNRAARSRCPPRSR